MPLSRIQLYQGSPIPSGYNTPSISGQIAYDGNHFYIAAANNTWLRTQLSPWSSSASDTNFSSVSLLMNFEGNFLDQSSNPKTLTASGGISTSIIQSRSGSSSALFDGINDSIGVSDSNNNLVLGSGDYTVEAWVYPLVYNQETLIGNRNFSKDLMIISADNTYFFIANDYSGTAGQLAYYSTDTVAAVALYSSQRISRNIWSHIAWCRSGSTLKSFINGSQVASTTETRTYSQSLARIGATPDNAGRFFNGYIDSLRITKGIARYTTSFNVPITSFPTY
jgi:hypothetical protein